MFLIEIILLVTFFTKWAQCVYITVSATQQMSPGLFGLLDESQFNFTSLDNENSYEGFPSSIQVQLQIFEIYLNLTLNATSMMNKQIYTKDYTSSEISQNELKLEYQLYFDNQNNMSATLINNTDLAEKYGTETVKYPFRIVLNTLINGYEIEFQPAVVVDSKKSSPKLEEFYSIKTNQPCEHNICLNDGTCLIGFDNQIYCVCSQSFSGKLCETKNITVNTSKIGTSLKNYANFNDIREIFKQHTPDYSKRSKRAILTQDQDKKNNVTKLYLEYLVVVDSTTIDFMLNLYPNASYINDYMNIIFTYIVSQVNKRYYVTFDNDKQISINITMAGLLVLPNPADTQWTNSSLVSVPGFPYYNNLSTCVNDVSVRLFANTMSTLKLNISFDYAAAIVNLDIWLSDATKQVIERKAVCGYTISIGGICDDNSKYSILELHGFQNILWAAHELGHSLGAVHDGDRVSAPDCSSEDNYIMTSSAGKYNGPANYLLFSECSISSIKLKIFFPNISVTDNSVRLKEKSREVSSMAKCLLNMPKSIKKKYIGKTVDMIPPVAISNFSFQFPGQCFTLDEQCQASFGNMSVYCNGVFNGQNRDEIVCQSIYCKTSKTPGPCAGGNFMLGIGALDGSPCTVSKDKIIPRVCYKGKCVSKRSLNIPICDKAKCRSAGGKCVNDPFKITNQFKMMNIDIQQSTELPSLARFMPLQNDDSSITTTSSSYNTFEWEWIEYNNNWYFYNSLYLVHSAAERYCNLFDATLAEITDFDQLKFLANNVMFENYFAWVGGYSKKLPIFYFQYNGVRLNNSIFCTDSILKIKRIKQECVSIKNKQENCLNGDLCFHAYPSICQWKNGTLPTTVQKTTLSTSTTSLTSNAPLTRVTVCNQNELNIECPIGYSIQIFKAFYGRSQNGTCGSSWNTNCTYDATNAFKNVFTGYQSVIVNFTSYFVGYNPCPGVSKYAIIDYLCIPNNNRIDTNLITCREWMKTATFIKENDMANQCNCSNNKIVSWSNISKCKPVVTTFLFYEGFVTNVIINTTVFPVTTTMLSESLTTSILLPGRCKRKKN